MEPSGLVRLAARLGLPCVALTDHDTMDGVEPAREAGRACGVEVLPGIEISAFDFAHGKKVHLLCYFPKRPQALLELCAETRERRTEATLRMAEKVARRFPITPEDVRLCAGPSASLYKQHIMLALMQRGYTLSVFGELFDELFSARKNGWAREEFAYPDIRDALRLAVESGGAPVLAHPGVYGNFEIIGELSKQGLAGIEAHHPRQSPEDTRRALEAARECGLICTGGTDFHGATASKATPLGTRLTEEAELARLFARFGEE